MKKLSTVITDAANGSDSAAEKLSAVGLSIEDLNGKSQDEQLSMVITALQGMESGAERTAAANDLLGKSATDICECNGIRYVKLKHSNDLIKTAQSIKEAFRKCHTFFQTNDEEDIEILRTRFQNWRKQK